MLAEVQHFRQHEMNLRSVVSSSASAEQTESYLAG
jgi:hypothetical protein